MPESDLDVVQQLAKEKEEIRQKIEIALNSELHGKWVRDGKMDNAAIQSALSEHLTPNKEGLIEHPSWVVSVRNSHLYKELVDTAFSALYNKYGTSLSADQIARNNELRVAEELLHSVPTLGNEAILDRIYCTAFFYDTNTTRHIIQSFFTYNDPTDDYKLLAKVVKAPHIVLGTKPEGIDKQMLETAEQKSN